MKKKLFLTLAIILCFAVIFTVLTACTNKEFAGKYYKVEGGVLNGESWIELTKNGKWTDDEGASGTYEVKDGAIDFYKNDSDEILLSGTISGDDLVVEFWGMESHYRRGNPGDSATETPDGGTPTTYYTVTFNSMGGSEVASVQVAAGGTIATPTAPIRTGFDFGGWYLNDIQYDFNSPVNSDLTLTAAWSVQILDIRFVADGILVKQIDVEYGDSISSDRIPAVPEKQGYTGEWSVRSFNNLTSSLTVNAIYTRIEYDVTFVLNYTGVGQVTKRTENGLITYVPERPGYIFNGWWYSGGQTESGYILTHKHDLSSPIEESGVILYAEWVEESERAEQLSAPVVSMGDGVFYWDPVKGATKYTITIIQDYKTILTKSVNSTQYRFPSNYDPDYYTVRIVANGDGINTYNSVATSKNYAHKILASVTNIRIDDATSVLTWSGTANATTYKVYIDNKLAKETGATSFDMSDYDAGSYSVKIMAVRSGWTSSTTSTQTITKIRLKTPEVDVVSTHLDALYVLSWEASGNADTYYININGKRYTTTETSYTIDCATDKRWNSENKMTITVDAFDSNTEYLISVGAEEITLDKKYALNINKMDGGDIILESETYTSNFTVYYVKGAEVNLTAATNSRYTFIGWYEGEIKLTGELTYSFAMPAVNKTYTAKWIACPVTLLVEDRNAGRPLSVGTRAGLNSRANCHTPLQCRQKTRPIPQSG